MYGLADIDEKLFNKLVKLGVKSQFFIEAGANDGLCQSNTAILEFLYGWRGILVEPNQENFLNAKANRPNSTVINCALVSDQHSGRTIRGTFSKDSRTRWNGLCSGATEFHLKEYPEWVCEVPALTLSKILHENNAPKDIGVLSLDVEGFEIEALRGMDLEIWRPHVIVLEIGDFKNQEVFDKHVLFMEGKDYVLDPETLSEHDFIFVDKRK